MRSTSGACRWRRWAATSAVLVLFAAAWPGGSVAQSVDAVQQDTLAPLGVRLDRFGSVVPQKPAALPRLAFPDTATQPRYWRMGLAGMATGVASALVTHRFLVVSGLRSPNVDPRTIAAFPGSVLIPVAVHYANGRRGSLLASVGASLAVYAGAAQVLGPAIVVLPVVQVPVAMLIEAATMGGESP